MYVQQREKYIFQALKSTIQYPYHFQDLFLVKIVTAYKFGTFMKLNFVKLQFNLGCQKLGSIFYLLNMKF